MDYRLFFPATLRNRICIGDVLSNILDKGGSILEIASGSGEHGVVFQKRFPDIIWQLSDPNIIHRKSISSWIDHEKLNKKMPQPLAIDVEVTPWMIPYNLKASLQGIICINLIHISSWNCTVKLFEESGNLLKKGQFLMLYGPFKIDEEHISKSNKLFDKELKIKNKSWGVRNLADVAQEGIKNGFIQRDVFQMPANNLSVVFRKVTNKRIC